MNPLIIDLPKHTKYKRLLDDISNLKGDNDISIIGLTNSQKAHMVYSLAVYSKRPSIFVCTNVMQARKTIQDLKFYSDIEIVYFPAREIVYYDISAQSREIENARIYATQKILSKENIIVVTTIDALTQKMMPKETYIGLNIKLNKDSSVNLEELVKKLDRLGYKRTSIVEGKGQFAVRGGILDIFLVDTDIPYRIELFGDEIDSIRQFNIETQKSINTVDSIEISYASEYIFDNEKITEVVEKLNEVSNDKKISSNLKEKIEEDIKKIEDENYENTIYKYFELFVDKQSTLLDYLDNYVIYIDEIVRSITRCKNICYENSETLKMLSEKEYLDIRYAIKNLTFEELEQKFKHMTNVYLETLNTDRILHAKRKEYSFSCREVNFFRSSVDILIQDLQNWKKEEKIVLLVYPSMARVEQIKNILIDSGVRNITYIENTSVVEKFEKNKIYITTGILSSGYVYEDFNFVLVAEEVSGLSNISKKKKLNKNFEGQIINSYDDLEIGDYVVHENHGIGIYKGIDTVEIYGVYKDYIKIEYENNATLYVPITQLDSVKKYMCDDNSKPILNTLGSKQWQKTKRKVSEHVKEIAKELIILYAKRKNAKGFKFSKDTPWQKEFEDNFKYELTDDQKQAIEEIKQDMEEEIPMDRLLCGDVGYGKTELALRAAFKAVMDSKQVAYLVPTTVLCLQQYRTFKERMEKFSIKVEMLSRFVKKSKQDQIIQKLNSGEVDVVIGTHRMLSKDVQFSNLGFLVIDEEHRFGVRAKETIKKLKENVDVLSMTATPIPRTLHMSMIGVRSMSTLTKPPLERMPVHTYVLEYDYDVIKEAIEKELSRDGQVFYIYNRVDKIEEVATKVQSMVKDARVVFAHGQMPPDMIEDIMIKFMEHEIDVIVCTTILESGIDIQNANTIIVEEADKLGLAQLYQIRGRVGRSSRLAYAYITYNKNKQISEIAEKRLKAIKDFTEFGSGFKIAMRDLEIRGAGNLLGSEQSGHIASVGYELYVSMLERALNDEKLGVGITNSQKDSNIDVKIDINVSAYISDRYISDLTQKIMIYQKISNIQTKEDALIVIDELIDRYGDIPKETENLFKVVEIRNKSREIGITKISIKNNYLVFEPSNLKFWLTKESNNDILAFVQIAISQIEDMLKN